MLGSIHPRPDGRAETDGRLHHLRIARLHFRRWRRTRPFAAGLLTMLGGICVLWGPLSLIRLATMPGSTVQIGVLFGALICLMGLFVWLTPHYAKMAGAITVVIAVLSLVTASLGGLIIGMLLSLIGGALAVAWQPVPVGSENVPRKRKKKSNTSGQTESQKSMSV